jgi:acyl carrier protein
LNLTGNKSVDNEAVEQAIYESIWRVKPSLKIIPMTPETNFSNLSLQSIEMISVVFEMEDIFDLSIVDSQLDTFLTVAEAREVVLRLLREKAKAAGPSVRVEN